MSTGENQVYSKYISSPLGTLTLIASDQGMQAVHFQKIAAAPLRENHQVLDACDRELQEYFSGQRREFTVPLDLSGGTAFQREVWLSLAAIPYGKVISYAEQTRRLGRGQAFRAVGAANGKNPLAIILPCHRVVSSQGLLHGYSGGLELKEWLLEREGVSCKGGNLFDCGVIPAATR